MVCVHKNKVNHMKLICFLMKIFARNKSKRNIVLIIEENVGVNYEVFENINFHAIKYTNNTIINGAHIVT